jgi:hypothetical protein
MFTSTHSNPEAEAQLSHVTNRFTKLSWKLVRFGYFPMSFIEGLMPIYDDLAINRIKFTQLWPAPLYTRAWFHNVRGGRDVGEGLDLNLAQTLRPPPLTILSSFPSLSQP